jgi:hypothetical protein
MEKNENRYKIEKKAKKVKKSQKKGLFLKKMEKLQFFSVEKKTLRRSPFRFL